MNLSFSNIPEENSFTLSEVQKSSHFSLAFRNVLVSNGYKKFDGKAVKGDFCYDSYYKYVEDNNELKYIIYCYCYNLKMILDESDTFEFNFEVQLESERGIIEFSSVQWDFRTIEIAKENMEYFEEKSESIWKIFGSKKYPT